jgi:hypothetical protein
VEHDRIEIRGCAIATPYPRSVRQGIEAIALDPAVDLDQGLTMLLSRARVRSHAQATLEHRLAHPGVVP